MSLFGTSPTDGGNRPSSASLVSPSKNASNRAGLFDDEPTQRSASAGLFDNDGDTGADSPWSMPSPRKQQSRAQIVRNLLPPSDVPESYIETFDVIAEGSSNVTSDGVAKVFAAARLHDQAKQSRIVSLVAPDAEGDKISLGRAEFNVLLALVGLAQENEYISLDGVDERRRNLPLPKLSGLTAEPVLPPIEELAAKIPQTPSKDQTSQPSPQRHSHSNSQNRNFRPAMDDPEDDPWNTPDMHKNHNHNGVKPNGTETNGHTSFGTTPEPVAAPQPVSQPPAETPASTISRETGPSAGAGWGYFDGSSAGAGAGFNQPSQDPVVSPFGGNGGLAGARDGGLGGGGPGRTPSSNPPFPQARSVGGRTGGGVEENILVTLMPEKEGLFMFQHHNYEVSSQRKGNKVIRRYSDFVWLLDCLHKRYPFRMLPLLPPKRVAVNGNHLSNDGAFIEKRRRGLARFLNALVRHPIMSQEQLVVMFLTVPTELAVWRKQATISVQDEFSERVLPPGLEESLPPTLEELFNRTKSGVRRSAELYINVCNIMDRLVKRQEGVAADHGRIAMMLTSLMETSEDTYATDGNEVPLLNDGLNAMSNHLRTSQTLMEEESRAWDQGVLEDLKRQRDSLVSIREMFERRERLDKDNIPYLERRIQTNENKLAGLRAKPEGTVKSGEIERVAESIIKDKESIVRQHNRSIFVKECIRDELLTFQTTQYHVSYWNQDWAGERVKYAEMLSDNWRRLLDELEGMPLGD